MYFFLKNTKKGITWAPSKSFFVMQSDVSSWYITLYILLTQQALLKVNNRNTRTRWNICSNLKIKTPERVFSSFNETSPIINAGSNFRHQQQSEQISFYIPDFLFGFHTSNAAFLVFRRMCWKYETLLKISSGQASKMEDGPLNLRCYFCKISSFVDIWRVLITPLTCSNPNPGVDKSDLTISDMKTLSKYYNYTRVHDSIWNLV